MKRPNWKVYKLAVLIELIFLFLCLIGLIIFSLYIFDNTFPVFKYSMLYINIISYAILITSIAGIIIVTKKWRRIIKKCIEPNPNDRYDNTLQIINELASIDENLDIRYGRDANREFWESPKGNYIYKINLIPKIDKFDIKVCKTKEGKTIICNSLCSNNIDRNSVIPKLEAIFSKL